MASDFTPPSILPRLGFMRYFMKPHLRERIYALLTSEFFQLDPDERYPFTEKDIARILYVPLHAVREALAQLEGEGVIERRPKLGIIAVNPKGIQINHETLDLLYEIRKLIECRNARSAATANDEELEDNLRECLFSMRGVEREMALQKKASHEFHALVLSLSGYDVRFHALIAEVVRDDFSHFILEMILARLLPHRRLSLKEPGRLAETLKEHEAILENIENHDPEGASRAMEYHVDRVRAVRTRQTKNMTRSREGAPQKT